MKFPDADALSKRRQKRAWRHCRKNRDLRLGRLRILMEKHGLVWPAADKMGTCGKSDPFILRLRAVNQGLGGPEALAICLRHAATHRGYDYSLGDDDNMGDYPWGDSNKGSDAMKWLGTATLNEPTAQKMQELFDEFEWKAKGNSTEEGRAVEETAYSQLIADRLAYSKEHNIARTLADHAASDKHTNLRKRARGENFPRSAIEQHIRDMVLHPRNRDYVREPEAFLEALFYKARSKEEKPKAIFHYNRKTYPEMREHWAGKRRNCPYTKQLGLPEAKCDAMTNWMVRQWLILEFLATRRLMVDLLPPKMKGAEKSKSGLLRYPHRPGAEVIRELLRLASVEHEARVGRAGPDQLLTKEAVFAVLDQEVKNQPDWATAKIAARSKVLDPNHSYFDQLWDLLQPAPAGLRGTSSLCAASAAMLYGVATGLKGEIPLSTEDFAPTAIHRRLTELEYYLWKRRPRFEFGIFPQVEKLTGPLRTLEAAYLARKEDKPKGQPIGPIPCGGLLGRVFRECQEALGAACIAPDYCVIEVIGDAPRNDTQRAQIEKEQKDRREKRREDFDKACATDTGVASRRRRIGLHRQQGGVCPFTGMPLPDPLSQELEIEHLFPQSAGGLSVDDNLVLTTTAVNRAKNDRTPYDFACAAGLDWAEMLQHTKAMRWNHRKREFFAWNAPRAAGEPPQEPYPDFGNTTRVSQLARQLKAAMQLWMGLLDDADGSNLRIGTPTGWHTAQARRTWLPAAPGEIEKIRENQVHHLIDAAVLAHLPPGAGMNVVKNGGIFYSEMEAVTLPVKNSGELQTVYRPVTRVLPGLLPLERLAHWRPENADYPVCPVLKLSGSSKWQALGDETFWRQIQRDKPEVAQRTVLDPTNFADADKLLATLLRMTPQNNAKAAEYWQRNLRSANEIGEWLLKATPATKAAAKDAKLAKPDSLKLRDGTPIENVWKFATKGALKSVLGWSARVEGAGALGQLRSLSVKFDRMEIWLGFNWKRKAWEYQRRPIPDPTALKHLKRAGFIWSRSPLPKAPIYMQAKPDLPETQWKTIREIICPLLYPFSVKVGALRRGDVFRLPLGVNGALCHSGKPFWQGWFAVSAINSNGQVNLESQQFKHKSATPFATVKHATLLQSPCDAAVLAAILGLPPAAEKAAQLDLLPPVSHPSHDPPPSPTQRGSRSALESGQADFGF